MPSRNGGEMWRECWLFRSGLWQVANRLGGIVFNPGRLVRRERRLAKKDWQCRF